MLTIYIENEPYTVEKETRNLLEACLSLGFNLPFFCWHPALHSVGACRQCAVILYRDKQDTKGHLAMACMTAVKDGMHLSLVDPRAVAFRASIIEWLMINHPHDCPVCDEGGECHLQDMTVMSGHTYRRYRFDKRTYRNQDLGPFVAHEMNRCIQCYRCVRFYRDYAGGNDLQVQGWHDHVYFGRQTDGKLENPFSGNLVEVCPTGVFTDRTLHRHYTRKWDLQTAPSLCIHCGVGCNTIPGERYGMLRRVRNRYHHEVNSYFLCDRGRYGYEFVNDAQRLRTPQLCDADGVLKDVTKTDALASIGGWLRAGKVIGIASSRASLESVFALETLVGREHCYQGVADQESRLVHLIRDIQQRAPAHIPTLREVETADAVLILGEDPATTAPRLALSLRQAALQGPMAIAREMKVPLYDDAAIREAIQDATSPFYVATPAVTFLDAVASTVHRAAPDDLARLGFAIAQAIDAHAPDVPDLSDAERDLAALIARDLLAAKRPLVVSGYGAGSEAIIKAAANVGQALCRHKRHAALSYTVPACNSVGIDLLETRALADAVQAVRDGEVDTLVLVETDLYRILDPAIVDEILQRVPHIVVLDHLRHATAARAHALLPAATFAEADGTLVNAEGRMQRFFQVFVPGGDIQASWKYLGELCRVSRQTAQPWNTLDDIMAALATTHPLLREIADAAPGAAFRVHGQKIARQSQRSSGRTAVTANIDVHEPAPPDDPDSPLTFSMEGSQGRPPTPLEPRFWAPGWNSGHALTKFQQEIDGPLIGGPAGVRLFAPGTGRFDYFTHMPASPVRKDGQWLLVPVYQLFGSEELSSVAPGIAAATSAPYLALQTVPEAWGRTTRVVVTVAGQTLELPLRSDKSLPDGIAILPVGLPGMPYLPLPAIATVVPAGEEGNDVA